jgi:hypothetical protein
VDTCIVQVLERVEPWVEMLDGPRVISNERVGPGVEEMKRREWESLHRRRTYRCIGWVWYGAVLRMTSRCGMVKLDSEDSYQDEDRKNLPRLIYKEYTAYPTDCHFR